MIHLHPIVHQHPLVQVVDQQIQHLISSDKMLVFDPPRELDDWVRHVLELLSHFNPAKYSSECLRSLAVICRLARKNPKFSNYAEKACQYLKHVLQQNNHVRYFLS